ncbi:hypothetical protein GCM10007291_07190 [Gemmobacter nanjingensis]|jgi:hypothetical protein|uniref:Phage tail assembly chaperone n=1 Tax=Gemmobacter nanjingensis TaxID=488454 RepID=A0ABQ3F7V9_9RHOB|nr:phage tail assembly chaperone [Gemmobacter nanjingensis]GHC12503.1 hypothetical protein GCM10007291_07190 [Gemmobacter nanjingensis]
MGLLPAQVWAMTPLDTDLLITGWNEAQGDQMPAAPTMEEMDDLIRRYG